LSWMEQKAVAILMSLLHLGVKGIYLGPKPPAWITPNILAVLQDNLSTCASLVIPGRTWRLCSDEATRR